MDTNLAAVAAVTPECRGLQERPDEWWLGLLAIPKSIRFATWTPRTPSYRRGWTFELPETAHLDVVSFERAEGEPAVAVVMDEPTGRYVVGWFSAAREAEARGAVACLNEEVAAIWHHWRTFGAERAAAHRHVTFEQGHEHAPDARWGLQILTLADDGRYTYMQRRAGRLVVVAAGAFDPDRARAVFDDLERSTFPQVAPHPFPPGASVLTISMPPDRRVDVDRRFGLGLDGYREAITALMDMVTAARTSAAADRDAALVTGSGT